MGHDLGAAAVKPGHHAVPAELGGACGHGRQPHPGQPPGGHADAVVAHLDGQIVPGLKPQQAAAGVRVPRETSRQRGGTPLPISIPFLIFIVIMFIVFRHGNRGGGIGNAIVLSSMMGGGRSSGGGFGGGGGFSGGGGSSGGGGASGSW